MADRPHPIIRAVEGLSTLGAFLSAVCMLLITGLILVEIVMRAVAGASTLIASEYSGYLLVALVTCGFGYTLKENGFIRITIIWTRLSPKRRNQVEIGIGCMALAIATYACWKTGLLALESYQLGISADSISETPIWIPQSIIPMGFFVFTLQLAAYVAGRLVSSPTR